MKYDQNVLFEIGDGPEYIKIYTSEDRAVIDWSPDIPGLYIEIHREGVFLVVGPFELKTIREYFEKAAEKSK